MGAAGHPTWNGPAVGIDSIGSVAESGLLQLGDMTIGQLLIGGIALLIGGVMVVAGLLEARRAWNVSSSDTTDAANIRSTDGPVEVDGTAQPLDGAEAFEAPVCGHEAVIAELQAEEEFHSTTGERERQYTEVIARPFRVVDDTGAVAVDPDGATFHLGGSSYETGVRPGDPMPSDLNRRLAAVADEIDEREAFLGENEDAEREFEEARIATGDDVHVIGAAVQTTETPRNDVTAALVEHPEIDEFAISAGTESSVIKQSALTATGMVAGGGLVIGFGVLVFLGIVG